MFNLPNNVPYTIIIESDNGYMVMKRRWESVEGGEMGPKETFETFTDVLDVLSSIETFMAGSSFNETD